MSAADGSDTAPLRFECLYDVIKDLRRLDNVYADALQPQLWKIALNSSMFTFKTCSACSRRLYASNPERLADDRYELRLVVCRRCVALNTLLQELFFDHTWGSGGQSASSPPV